MIALPAWMRPCRRDADLDRERAEMRRAAEEARREHEQAHRVLSALISATLTHPTDRGPEE